MEQNLYLHIIVANGEFTIIGLLYSIADIKKKSFLAPFLLNK